MGNQTVTDIIIVIVIKLSQKMTETSHSKLLNFIEIFAVNSVSKQILSTSSVMSQPARRTFLPGHVVVIICSITIQLLNLPRTIHLEDQEHLNNKIAIIAFLGLLYLSYPLLGYIADVCLIRYQSLKCSFIFLIIGCTIGLLMILVAISLRLTELIQENLVKSYMNLGVTAYD